MQWLVYAFVLQCNNVVCSMKTILPVLLSICQQACLLSVQVVIFVVRASPNVPRMYLMHWVVLTCLMGHCSVRHPVVRFVKHVRTWSEVSQHQTCCSTAHQLPCPYWHPALSPGW